MDELNQDTKIRRRPLCVVNGVLEADPFTHLRLARHNWEEASKYDPMVHDSYGDKEAFELIKQFQEAGRLKLLVQASRHTERLNNLIDQHGDWITTYLPRFDVQKMLEIPEQEVRDELKEEVQSLRAINYYLTNLLDRWHRFDELRGEKRQWYIGKEDTHYSAIDPDSVTYTEFRALMRPLVNPKKGADIAAVAEGVDDAFARTLQRLDTKIEYLVYRKAYSEMTGHKFQVSLLDKLTMLMPDAVIESASRRTNNKINKLLAQQEEILEAANAELEKQKAGFSSPAPKITAAEIPAPELPAAESTTEMVTPLQAQDEVQPQKASAAEPPEVETETSFLAKHLLKKISSRQQQINQIFGLKGEDEIPFQLVFHSKQAHDIYVNNPEFLKKQLEVMDLMVECAVDSNYQGIRKVYDEYAEAKKLTPEEGKPIEVTPFHKVFLNKFRSCIKECNDEMSHGQKREHINKSMDFLKHRLGVQALAYQEKYEHEQLFGKSDKGRAP